MNKIGKRILAMILAGTMVFSMAACGSNSTDTKSTAKSDTEATTKANDDTTEAAKNTSDTAATNGVDTSEAITITMLTLGNKPTNGRMEAALEKINELLSEKVNATLELVYIEWADWQTQYNLALAGGDTSYDLVATATDWLDAWPNTKKGAFMALSEDMLQTYAPQTYATVESWDDCIYEGEIYFIPEDNYNQYTNHGMFYRGDWADEAGIGVITSFEQLGEYFQYIADNKDGVTPWDVPGTIANGNGLANGYIQSTTDAIVIDGAQIGTSTIYHGTSADDPYTIYSPYMDGDGFEEFAVMMKEWADAGYWREDVLNFDGEMRELFYTGTSGADQHHSQTFYGEVKSTSGMDVKQEGSDARMFSFSLPSKNLVKTSITHGAMAVSNFSQNAERALMVYDLLRNDKEIYTYFNYGIEDVDYVMVDENTFDRPDGWDKTLDGLDINFWWGRNDNLEMINNQDWDGKADMIAEYDTYAIDYPYSKLVVDTSAVETQIAAMSDVCASWIPRIAFGKVDDPVAAVATFREEMIAAGYNEVLENFQSQMDDVYK